MKYYLAFFLAVCIIKLMTDELQKDLIRELLAIREGMATKADLVNLEEGLTNIIVSIAQSVPSRSPEPPAQDSSPSNYKMEKLKTELTRLTERVDRLSNWYQAHTDLLELFNQRLERLEAHVRSVTQTERASAHTWVPTPSPEPPAQDSTKTNPEKPCDQ